MLVVGFRYESPLVTGTARPSGVRVHGACIWVDGLATHEATNMYPSSFVEAELRTNEKLGSKLRNAMKLDSCKFEIDACENIRLG